MPRPLTRAELEVVLFMLDADGDPLKHYDDPHTGYDLLSSARSKLRAQLRERRRRT